MKEILLFNVESNVVKMCHALNLSVQVVDESYQNCLLGQLADHTAQKGEVVSAFRDEMAVFCDFDDEDLQQFLTFLKAIGHPIALKAMLTPTNRFWTVHQLHDELVKEHQWVQKQKGMK